MADHARSDDPAVQAQLDRFAQLSPGRDILGLERITLLMERLGNPHCSLPPVFHVAGTNGKGSTCAFLRAALEAASYKVHAYTSPHLCRFNERIRLAGSLIDDAALAPLLAEVLDAAGDIGPSFFEATTAAAFLAFARTPADAAIIEVGLGGRLDATNVILHPLICGIAQLGVDHEAFLGNDAITIAGEKAGIAKHGVPLITMAYPPAIAARVGDVANQAGAHWLPKGSGWDAVPYRNRIHYKDKVGKLDTQLPRLAGGHQVMNAALAIAMLRHQNELVVPESALKAAIGWTDWPARMQLLGDGPLRALLPPDAELWLDGCHNPAAADLVAEHIKATAKPGQPLHIICGILANKAADGILEPFRTLAATLFPVPVPDHAHHAPAALAQWAAERGLKAVPATSVEDALATVAGQVTGGKPPKVLIMGSLYLAGEVLRANGQLPV
jgi:dihydrofolate synthase / folylpolyglutamate synthase